MKFLFGFLCFVCIGNQAIFAVDSTISNRTVTISNSSDQPQIYFLKFARWAYADLLYRIDGGKLQHKRTGEFVAYRERDFAFTNEVLMRIELAPGERLVGEVFCEWRAYLGPRPVNEEVEIVPEAEMIPYLWNRAALGIVATGMLLFILVYNLIFYSVTRNRLYRFYILSLISMLLETLRTTGIFMYLFADFDSFASNERYFGAAFTFILVINSNFFINDLAGGVRKHVFFNFFYYLMMACAVVAFGLTLVEFDLGFRLVCLGFPIFLLVMLTGAGVNLYQGRQYALEIFIVCGILLVCNLIHVMGISGWVSMSGDVFNGVLSFGLILVDTIMTFILGRIVWDLREENAMQREEIIRDLKTAQRARQRIAYSVSEIQEGERRNFSQRLHDDLQNLLVTIRYAILGLQAAPPKDQEELRAREVQLLDLTEEGVRKVQQIAYEIMPQGLEDAAGFFQAIESFLDPLARLDLEVRHEFTGDPNLPLHFRALAFRIVLELVTNILKHSEAGVVVVRASHLANVLRIEVTDDGKGITSAHPETDGHGLSNISTNVALHGGEFKVAPRTGGGTSFSVMIPTKLENEVIKRATPGMV